MFCFLEELSFLSSKILIFLVIDSRTDTARVPLQKRSINDRDLQVPFVEAFFFYFELLETWKPACELFSFDMYWNNVCFRASHNDFPLHLEGAVLLKNAISRMFKRSWP